jgi:hypothetical protein
VDETTAPEPATYRPAEGERIVVRPTVPGWAGQTGTVHKVAPAGGRSVSVRMDEDDEIRGFDPDELGPADPSH